MTDTTDINKDNPTNIANTEVDNSMDNILNGGQSTVKPYESKSADVMDLITEAKDMTYEESPFRDKATGMMDSIVGSSYESPYESDIQSVINDLKTAKFDYSLENDENFNQAVNVGQRKVFEEMGQRGILQSTVTADRVANVIGELAPIFREQAFNEFRGTQQDKFTLVNTLAALDTEKYGRYRDSIGDKYSLASYYNDLANQDYDRFKLEVDQLYATAEWVNTLDIQNYKRYSDNIDREHQEKIYQLEVAQTDITNKRNEIADAWYKVQQVGYVDNETAGLLKVDPGTPSREVREQAQRTKDAYALQSQRAKDQMDLANLKYKQEQALIAEKEKHDALYDPETIFNYASSEQLASYNKLKTGLLDPTNVNTDGDPIKALDLIDRYGELLTDDKSLGSGLVNILKLDMQTALEQTSSELPTLSSEVAEMQHDGLTYSDIVEELRTNAYYNDAYTLSEVNQMVYDLSVQNDINRKTIDYRKPLVEGFSELGIDLNEGEDEVN